MYVARNKDNTLYFFSKEKPNRSQSEWYCKSAWKATLPKELNNIFNFLKWEDEPLEVNLFSNDMIDDIKAKSYQEGYDAGYEHCDTFNSQWPGIGED